MSKKGALELNWINKNKSLYYEYDKDGNPGKPIWVDKNDIRVAEPRVLKLVKEYGDCSKLKDPLDNALIKGDNLLALRTLVELFKGRPKKNKVKCVYIDPPYNTGNAFENYEDNLAHSEWLSMMKARLVLLRELMREDGIIFISIDDQEDSYLRLVLDEVFGRNNFVNKVIVKPANPVGLKMKNADKRIVRTKEYIIVYAKNYEKIKFNILHIAYENYGHYNLYIKKNLSKNPNDWEVVRIRDIIAQQTNRKKNEVSGEEEKKFALAHIHDVYCSSFIADRRDRIQFAKKNPKKVTIYKNPDGTEMYMYKKRTLFPLIKKAKEIDGKFIPAEVLCDLWLDIKWDGIAKEGEVTFQNGKKPERLIKRILDLCTDKGDIILDSFLGSGTTSATAHKMERKWIGLEIGKHADTHAMPRLKNVISRKDQTGISKIIDWQGGGGFRYYKLGDTLIKDNDINWKLNEKGKLIAEAVFLNTDFKYQEKIQEGIFFGKKRKKYALCIIDKVLKVLSKKELKEIINKIPQDYDILEIFTNLGLALKSSELNDNIQIKKIPYIIQQKFNKVNKNDLL